LKAKDLICEIDHLLRRKIVDLAAPGSRSRGYVLGSKLLVEARLQGGDLFRGIVGDSGLVVEEWVCCGGGVAVLVTWSSLLSVAFDM